MDKEFMLCTNACKRGLGGVLMQEGQVVRYESRKLNEHEQNYAAHDLELETIIHALNMWRQYLRGRWFVLMSDHTGLRYLFDQTNKNTRKSRQLATIREYFKIRYIKGNENKVVDALSRRVQVNHIVAMSSYGKNLQDRILQAIQQDGSYMELRMAVI